MATSALNKLALQYLRPAPIRVGPRPVMIFGMGSHTYPASRSSVGYFLVNILGKRLGTPFHRFSDCNAYVAHYEPENLLLVQPDTYFVSENHQCMRRIANHYPVDPQKSVLIYHEPGLPLGTVEYMTKGRTDINPDLHNLAQELKTQEFPRIAVGIQYPNANSRFEPPLVHQLQSIRGSYTEFFLLNKFPQAHWVQLHEVIVNDIDEGQEVVPKIFAAVDKAVGKIRQDFPLTSVDEWNPLRPELVFESESPAKPQVNADGEEDPLVYVGPKDATKHKKLTKMDQDRRLNEIRRVREQEPEFARLLAMRGRGQ